ncbi:MAG TPA: bifunctional hydroxymethylpyrimidine kinase/phosphomethylpyrimidine kinase [Myxococcota bacterium]|nr:bifunctional hydroxymethylpyrimidine kinase/phosphomethylpyrimidine kinase [Myxococcota bacterium]
MRTALSIAGSDPTGGAGLQLDLQVFRALGVHGAGVVTALTVQDTARVHRVLPAFPNVVLEQLRTLLRDLRPDAVKLGMLATDDVARSVELGLAELFAPPPDDARPAPPLVVDPVLAASDGTPLLERRARGTLVRILAHATLVTPNLPEAAALTELDVSSEAGAAAAGRRLVEETGVAAALVKGGHREGPPHDLFVTRDGVGLHVERLEGERIGGGRVHGTGCALASAIAAGLAQGRSLRDAVLAARAFLREAIRRAEAPGRGARLLVFP